MEVFNAIMQRCIQVDIELYKKTFYTIKCIPSNPHRIEHSIGIFSSLEKAQALIPKSGQSTKYDGSCTWYYTIVPVEIVYNVELLKLDQYPADFPYY